jgi:hypothetical protein
MGAAQSIGWILTIDDTDLNSKLAAINTNVSSIQDAFGDTLQEAIEPIVLLLKDIREISEEVVKGTETLADPDVWKDIAEHVGTISTDTEKITDAVKEAAEKVKKTDAGKMSFWKGLGTAAGLVFKFVSTFVSMSFKIIGFALQAIQNIVLIVFVIGRALMGIIGFVLKGVFGLIGLVSKVLMTVLGAIVKVVGVVIKVVAVIAGKILSAAFTLIGKIIKGVFKAISTVARFMVKTISFALRTLAKVTWGIVKGVFKLTLGILKTAFKVVVSVIGMLGKIALGVVKIALSPIYLLAKFITTVLKKALGSIGEMIMEVVNALLFALEPLFMAFRLMIIPFVYLMLPIILKAAVKLVLFLIEGAKWLWSKYLKDVFNGPGGSWAKWWWLMKQGWDMIWESLQIVWKWITNKQMWANFWSSLQKGWAMLWSSMQTVWGWITKPEERAKLWESLKAGVSSLWDWIKDKSVAWWNDLTALVKLWWSADGKPMADIIWAWATEKWAWIKEKVLAGWARVKEGSLWLLNKIRALIGGVLMGIGRAIFDFSVSAAAALGAVAGTGAQPGIAKGAGKITSFAHSLKQPVAFAEGGEVRGPTLAVLGEAGSELVIPVGTGVPARGIGGEAGGEVAPLGEGGGIADRFLKLVTDIRDLLSDMAGSKSDSEWVNDPDFDGEQHQGFWEG